jgi:FKBP-type peptidyl-prolyl cis-trans isomerase 2
MEKTKKGNFVEISFTGYHDGKPFDSNRPEDLKKINPDAKAEKTIVIIGQDMVVSGLDKALEEKEIGKKYEIHIPYKEAFGSRKRELVRTIPLSVFTKQKINPVPGQTLLLDNMLARVITISGARVITDFNNPLSGKDLDYEFTIIRKVNDEKEKCEAFLRFFLRLEKPNLEIQDKKVILKGPKHLEGSATSVKDKFKEIFGKALGFEEDLGSSQGGAPQQGEEARNKSESENKTATNQAPQQSL